MHDEVAKFIHAYGDAFRLGPGAIAEFYAEPCVTVRMGVVRVSQTREDTERLITEVDATDRARGFTYGEALAIDVKPLGATSALATVQWAYNGACAELLWKTTFSYNLHRRDGAWKILVQTMHDS
jgi:hypothetical protein